MKISYKRLKDYVPELPEVQKLSDIFTYHICEVEGIEEGDIFDLNILPNRAHDLLSHRGIAKELASLLGIPFVDLGQHTEQPESVKTNLKIDINSQSCRRYMGRIVRNVKVAPSPLWLAEFLESIGQRSINNIVDIANFIAYDLGQPTHAFDLAKISDEKIIIREAKEKEKMKTLDDVDIIFTENDMVIRDPKNVLAIAGIKGGKDSGVDSNTQSLILEVANFDPIKIRKTAQRLNIFTDSRKRFENNLSPVLAEEAMNRFSNLIKEVCSEAVFEEIVDMYAAVRKYSTERKLSFSVERISNILGIEVTKDEIEEILKRYNIEYEIKGAEIEIVVPPLRMDLEREEDIAEEIGRIKGYEKIKSIIPNLDFKPKINETFSKITRTREKLLSLGYFETITYSFSSKGEKEVLNSASDKNFLRTNLTDGLKESIKLNQLNAPLLQIEKAKIFEIGTVFLKEKEEIRVAFGDIKKIEEMTIEEFVKMNAESAEKISLEILSNREHQSFKMWSLFPFIVRDIAVWVPKEEDKEKLKSILKENATELLINEPMIFDVFTKGERISCAFRLVFQSYDRTLTDEEVNEIMQSIEEKIKRNPLWEIR